VIGARGVGGSLAEYGSPPETLTDAVGACCADSRNCAVLSGARVARKRADATASVGRSAPLWPSANAAVSRGAALGAIAHDGTIAMDGRRPLLGRAVAEATKSRLPEGAALCKSAVDAAMPVAAIAADSASAGAAESRARSEGENAPVAAALALGENRGVARGPPDGATRLDFGRTAEKMRAALGVHVALAVRERNPPPPSYPTIW
jgi:hypothetical protein